MFFQKLKSSKYQEKYLNALTHLLKTLIVSTIRRVHSTMYKINIKIQKLLIIYK